LSSARLDDANKRMGTHIDGFLGQDILQEFPSWKVDYKARVIDITSWDEIKRRRPDGR
jgi:hypothetical protein